MSPTDDIITDNTPIASLKREKLPTSQCPRFSRVLLCVAPVFGIYKGWPDEPHAGVAYLSEFLTTHGVENDVLDMRLGYSWRELEAKIRSFEADLVGLSIVTFEYDIQYELIARIKGLGIKTVVGGPHVSSLSETVLTECPADFGVVQEGEWPLLELCEGIPLYEIGNLIFREGENIICNPTRPLVSQLDDIPFPKFEKFELSLFADKRIPIITSRGCPYHCEFCAVQLVTGFKFRRRSPEHVLEEVRYWYDRGYSAFYIMDDNFTLNKNRVHRIIDLIEESGMKDLSFHCENGIRADRTDSELLERMRQVGFDYVAFGVESGSDRVLQRMRKGEDRATIEQAIKDACEAGMDVGLFFIIGNPAETPEDVEMSFDLALKYPVEEVFFYTAVPFPGTELHRWVTTNNYTFEDLDWRFKRFPELQFEPYFATPEFSVEERRRALAEGRRTQKLVARRALRRKLGRMNRVGRALTFILTPAVDWYQAWSWLLFRVRYRRVRHFLVFALRWCIRHSLVSRP